MHPSRRAFIGAALAAPDAVITPAALHAFYGVDVEIADVELADGRRRRVCLPLGGPAR